jgi:hypothetical protein
MRRIIIILSLSILILAAISLSACGTQGQPRIYFYEDSADVGKVPPGASLNYTFRFKNVGNAPLVIEEVGAQALEGC